MTVYVRSHMRRVVLLLFSAAVLANPTAALAPNLRSYYLFFPKSANAVTSGDRHISDAGKSCVGHLTKGILPGDCL